MYEFDELAPKHIKVLLEAILVSHPTPEIARSSIENVFEAGYLQGRADGIARMTELQDL